jgi:pimeloyl-ACP methyl ester carboxylesterase
MNENVFLFRRDIMVGGFVEKIFEKDGCSIHYWTDAELGKPWIILLHGAGADHRMFEEQIPIFKDKFSMLLWDARGHGLSRPIGNGFSVKMLMDDLCGIMKKESIENAVFLGQSMGENIAQEMAFYYPEKVNSLIIIDSTCNTMKLTKYEKLLLAVTPAILAMYPWKALVRQSARASSIKADVQDYIAQAFNKMGKKDFIRILVEATYCLHYEKDYKVNKNMLLLLGEKDGTGNIKKAAKTWPSREPKCSFHVIKNAGHCSNQDNPQEVNRIIGEFLDKYVQE